MAAPHLAPYRNAPWQPGQSGNPHGGGARTMRLATYARTRTKDGKKLVDFMLDVLEGKPLPLTASRAGRSRYPQTPKVEHRMVAAQWLADRGWGKAKELIELSGDATTTPEQRLALLRRLTDDERAQLRQLLAKALASAPEPSDAMRPPFPEDANPQSHGSIVSVEPAESTNRPPSEPSEP